MPTHLASLDSLVHPHQMEVQEFDSYALVLDARSAEAYQDDHVPGAVSVPVAPDRYSGGQSPSIQGGLVTAAGDSAPAMRRGLAMQVHGLSAGDVVLVYCDRGGLDSLVWASPLRAAGFRVDVLGGGWVNYRRWVDAGLEVLPRVLTFRPFLGPPVGGLCRVAAKLIEKGQQVIDLAALSGQHLIPGLTLQCDAPPSQAAFETRLLDALRRADPHRPVWIRLGLSGLGELALPPALRDALQRSNSMRLVAPIEVRARAWSDRLQAMGTGITTVLQAISSSAMPPATEVLERWRLLANAGQVLDALTEIIKAYIDPRSAVERWAGRMHVIQLASLTAEAVATEVERWLVSERRDHTDTGHH